MVWINRIVTHKCNQPQPGILRFPDSPPLAEAGSVWKCDDCGQQWMIDEVKNIQDRVRYVWRKTEGHLKMPDTNEED